MVSANWLKKSDLFGALDESQLNALLSHSNVQSFPEGEVIFRQGDEAGYLYVLIEGAVDLTVKAQEEIAFMTSQVQKEGEIFGIPSLIEPFRYNVTARCLVPSKILMIDSGHMKKRMEEDPRMGMEIMTRLASIYFHRLNELRAGVSKLLKIFTVKAP